VNGFFLTNKPIKPGGATHRQMGLDAYLTKKTYIGANWKFNEIAGNINITRQGELVPIKFDRVTYILENMAYWRNCRAIHQWFVDNLQEGNDDCRPVELERSTLERLLSECKRVILDPSRMNALIPSPYTEEEENRYFAELRDAVLVLEEVLSEPGNEYEYNSSW